MLGTFLRHLRVKAGKSVAAVVQDLGIARPTVYMWEGPRSRPDPVVVRRLCAYYGATESEIAEALRLRSLDHGVPPSEGMVDQGGVT